MLGSATQKAEWEGWPLQAQKEAWAQRRGPCRDLPGDPEAMGGRGSRDRTMGAGRLDLQRRALEICNPCRMEKRGRELDYGRESTGTIGEDNQTHYLNY